jgi:hypothetical protein
MRNLMKSIISGKGFQLKQFVRLQARARAHIKRPMDNNIIYSKDNGEIEGTFYFQALLPDITFQAQSLNPIPVLATPLSLSLLQPQNIEGRDRMGYLSMNQTRKLVLLQNEDAAVSVAQLVGIWVRFQSPRDCISSNPRSASADALQHPLTWAAAIRFLFADRVKRRVFVADDTFLLVNS